MSKFKNNPLQSCIILCLKTRSECQDALYSYCLPAGGRHVEETHIKLMMDCIQICQVAADFMSRNSPLYESTCAACADICEVTAESCDKVGGEIMNKCADICRRLADMCRRTNNLRLAA